MPACAPGPVGLRRERHAPANNNGSAAFISTSRERRPDYTDPQACEAGAALGSVLGCAEHAPGMERAGFGPRARGEVTHHK